MPATNVYELLASDKLDRYAVLLGIGEQWQSASDYERFTLLLEKLPMLCGTSFFAGLDAYLAQFGLDLQLTRENAAGIWKSVAERLSCEEIAPYQPPAPTDVEDLQGLESLATPFSSARYLNASTLLRTSATDCAAWEREAERFFGEVIKEDCDGVSLRLPTHFSFDSPDPYHVSQLLANEKERREGSNLLLVQCLRMLTRLCSAHPKTLVLNAACDTEQTSLLLRYLWTRVGTPSAIWMPSREDFAEAVSHLARLEMAGRARLAADLQALSEEEKKRFLRHAAAIYPIGRLLLKQ